MNNIVSYDGVLLNDYVIIKRIHESILPPIISTQTIIPGANGSRLVRKQFGPKIISIDIEMPAKSFGGREVLVRTLASILYANEEKELNIRGLKSYYATLDGNTDINNIIYYGETTLSFLASNPLAYGDKVIIDDIDGKTIINRGTAPAKGIITVNITSAVSFLEITLLNTGEFLYIEDDFNVGDIVVVDLNAEHITKNDYSAMPNLYLESDFFELPVGEFEISVSSGKADIEFRERWL